MPRPPRSSGDRRIARRPLAGGRRTLSGWSLWGVALAGAAPFLLIALALASAGPAAEGPANDPDAPPTAVVTDPPGSADPTMSDAAEDAATFAAGIREIALSAGQIIELEIKPGISDIREQAYDDDVLQGFSDRWAADFVDLRDGLDQVVPPEGLARSHALYVEALDGYREVALTLSAAVQVPVDEREPILQQAIDLGEATDEVWDRAQDLLANHLRTLGLDPTRWLPVS